MSFVHMLSPSAIGEAWSMSQPSSGFHTPNSGNFGKDLDCCSSEEGVGVVAMEVDFAEVV